MQYENRPTAFVAMRFSDDHWRDKPYAIIREELESAGYQVLRADELRTSGPVVDEVCRLLKEADFVVVDSSGDSHSVSYEIGFCHGIGRPTHNTLLLKNDANIPFNYRHYRHRVYKDMRHLRRLLRDYLDISEPLTDDMYGYSFTFAFSENGSGYIMDGAECLLDAILETGISGRCEIYSGEQFTLPGRYFTVSIALRLKKSGSKTASYDYWKRICKRATELTQEFPQISGPDARMSELAQKRAMKAWLLYCGAAEIRDGEITKILDIEEDGNFVSTYLDRKNEAAGQDGGGNSAALRASP